MDPRILCLAIAIVLAVLLRLRKKNQYPYPPGPPAHPIFGHLGILGSDHQEEKFHEWAQTYGDVIHLRLPGRDVIVLDTDEAARDLLDKRSSIYSSRPSCRVYEQMGWLYTATFLPYGKTWNRHRKFLHKYLGRKESEAYNGFVLSGARTVIKDLLKSPENYGRANGRFITSLVIRIAYGYEIESDSDPYIDFTDKMDFAVNNAGAPGFTAVDFFPFLRYFPSWFPGTHYVNWARQWKPFVRQLHDLPYDRVRKQMAAGQAEPSLLASLFEETDEKKLEDPETLIEIKGLANVIYSAGSDTSRSTLDIMLLLMVMNPRCFKKAQEEIDRVVGSGRLPELSDRENLPYVECFVQETLRWYPAVHSGVPHCSVQDDVYKGMFIPKGSIVFPNSRGITLDEKVYKNPREFYPERFLPKPEGNGEPHCTGVFGYGRRICPGQFLARNAIWMVAASMMAAFDISKAIGADGKEISPSMEFSVGIAHHPEHFDCVIKPRSEKARELIMSA